MRYVIAQCRAHELDWDQFRRPLAVASMQAPTPYPLDRLRLPRMSYHQVTNPELAYFSLAAGRANCRTSQVTVAVPAAMSMSMTVAVAVAVAMAVSVAVPVPVMLVIVSVGHSCCERVGHERRCGKQISASDCHHVFPSFHPHCLKALPAPAENLSATLL